MRRADFAVLALLFAPAIALAQAAGPSTSGQVVATAPPAPAAATPNAQVTQTDDVSDPDADQTQDGSNPHRVSGEVSVGVGTGGYREVDGEATAPVGDTGQVSVAVGGGQIGGGRR